ESVSDRRYEIACPITQVDIIVIVYAVRSAYLVWVLPDDLQRVHKPRKVVAVESDLIFEIARRVKLIDDRFYRVIGHIGVRVSVHQHPPSDTIPACCGPHLSSVPSGWMAKKWRAYEYQPPPSKSCSGSAA